MDYVTKINTIDQIFDRTLKRYRIQGKALSTLTGVSENHISEFRRGHLKTGITTDVLGRLLAGMEQIAPGSREYFCQLLSGGSGSNSSVKSDDPPLLKIEIALEELESEEEENQAILLMARKLRKTSNYSLVTKLY